VVFAGPLTDLTFAAADQMRDIQSSISIILGDAATVGEQP